MSGPDYSFEQRLLDSGSMWIAGVDEVGRGCLAGPVVAAAVVLRADDIPAGLADSKKLSKARREALFEVILAKAAAISLASCSPAQIDSLNIRQASLLAMRRAVSALSVTADHALIDGRDIPERLPCPATALIKGDDRSVSISAASIIAKVMRDRMMTKLDESFPQYGFVRHVGYGTQQHLAALLQFGPSKHHRLSFAPCKAASERGLKL